MRAFVVVTDPQANELFRVHAAGCRDIGRERQLYRRGLVSCIETVQAENAAAALAAELNEDFSGGSTETGWEHPPTETYPGGTFGAAGFEGRILPCAD